MVVMKLVGVPCVRLSCELTAPARVPRWISHVDAKVAR